MAGEGYTVGNGGLAWAACPKTQEEHTVDTCERCGADTVDAHGICQTCGWDAAMREYENGANSLGETRAANLPPAAMAGGVTRTPSLPPNDRGARAYTPVNRASHAGEGFTPLAGATAGGGRFCGSCGARIEPGQAFCGQCGTSISGTSGSDLPGTAQSLAPRPVAASRYQVGEGASWSTLDGDARTEMFAPSVAARNPYNDYGAAGGRAQSGYPPYGAGATPAPTSSSARSTRIILGSVCLVGSAISAIGAIAIALLNFH